MSEIRCENEHELISEIRKSRAYKDFEEKQILNKIEREKNAWKIINDSMGKYSRDILEKAFDTVDFYKGNRRWFGSMLAAPNRNLIFESDIETISKWITDLLYSNNEIKSRIDNCLKKRKLKGASKGLVTLLLYLSKPEEFNIWVHTTEDGLFILGRINEFKGNEFGENYLLFNESVKRFRDQNHLRPQEIDWILTFINKYVESDNGFFRISEDALEAEQASITVEDEDDEIDDIVGEPMELRVMRWTPTNEMGVVALFIEFRKELGFPLIEVIRTGFPDAAVFESSSKGYIRKYIEFEFKSSRYKSHLKSKRKCHYVVCWEHDWKDCPIPVIELKSQVIAILNKH